MRLSVLEGRYAVCRQGTDEPLPDWACGSAISSMTRTADELSVVCEERLVPEGVKRESGWRIIKVEGPLDFTLVGILASLAGALAEAGISIFALSTYDTDYLLIKEGRLELALAVLREEGHQV